MDTSKLDEKLRIEESNNYLKECFESNYLNKFVNKLHNGNLEDPIPTGFNGLDSVLNGGLRTGLYVIGAISSLGKTSFALQICDHIAKSGEYVLIFSLEMSANELIAKSISRHTLEIARADGIDMLNSKTAIGLCDRCCYENYNLKEINLINRAIKTHTDEYANNICIYECGENMVVNQIRGIIENFIHHIGKKPVVLVDYIQALCSTEIELTDKQNIDKTVIELKRISRDFEIPVIGISTFNRSSYNRPVSMESFKESGSIEYVSDVLIGLQFERIKNIESFDYNFEMKNSPRQIESVIIKNRIGYAGVSIFYDYYAEFNFFEERFANFCHISKKTKNKSMIKALYSKKNK